MQTNVASISDLQRQIVFPQIIADCNLQNAEFTFSTIFSW